MRRREFCKTAGAGALGLTTLSGCLGSVTGGSNDGPLRVATQPAFVDAPSTSPGAWIKEEFESRYDAELEWFVPDSQLSYFIQRRNEGVTIDTDMYVGLTADNLVQIDTNLGDEQLFGSFDTSKLDNAGGVIDDYRFDPQQRVIPTGASYISLVYDENEVSAPGGFEDLLKPEYEGTILLANPQSTETGMNFLLWTIHEYGADGYLDYWKKLADNDVHILGSWSDAYSAYMNEEAPIVVSYSTDQVYADRQDQDMSRHQIGFLDGQGYAYVSGTAKFADTDKDEVAHQFMDFMLDPEVQATVAVKNVGLPTVEDAPLPDDFSDLAHVPETPVSYGYDEIVGNLEGWRKAWGEQIAGQ